MIKLEKSKSGQFTLKYNNKYIHSKYDPVKESEQFIKSKTDIIEKDTILIYGIGLGYHINLLINYIDDDQKVYVFDYNNNLVQKCKSVYNEIFNHPNITIITGDDLRFYKKLSDCMDLVEDIIIHKPSLETIKETNNELYSLINGYSSSKISIEKISGLLNDNYKENIKSKNKNIKELIEAFKQKNRPYVIASAGPSLDYELKMLKDNRERFNIICVGSALRALMNNQILPDAIVIMDGKEVVAKQIQGFEDINVPLCFLSTASRWAVRSYNGPKYIFFNNFGEDDIIIKTGKTVAVSAMDIAIKSGAKEIIFLGQDLAFIGEKSHTETFREIYGFEDDVKKTSGNKTVSGINGEVLETTQGYLFFKDQIEKLIKDNKNIKFINCSKGAFIKGAKHMEFKDYVN
ncbi:MAG: DUF115 domain-containing protein [Clostridium beijerinckii]|nr:DUF115 domain-containing protein [Clostridium beijerinckii]MCI1577954.1 DUF115 domain-containing protein [Clostridium beijerinckii]MCI1583135.1 DUF115 domain-containing protein [Clostridium beijerinckii]MCI1620635.1 DUF115 domain-containing protein [Clostridium beijerinckii]